MSRPIPEAVFADAEINPCRDCIHLRRNHQHSSHSSACLGLDCACSKYRRRWPWSRR